MYEIILRWHRDGEKLSSGKYTSSGRATQRPSPWGGMPQRLLRLLQVARSQVSSRAQQPLQRDLDRSAGSYGRDDRNPRRVPSDRRLSRWASQATSEETINKRRLTQTAKAFTVRIRRLSLSRGATRYWISNWSVTGRSKFSLYTL